MKYKEIGLMFSDEYSINVTLKEILTNEKTKFYEKVSSNDIFVIIAKDKNGNSVCKIQIDNPTYFVKHFKVREFAKILVSIYKKTIFTYIF